MPLGHSTTLILLTTHHLSWNQLQYRFECSIITNMTVALIFQCHIGCVPSVMLVAIINLYLDTAHLQKSHAGVFSQLKSLGTQLSIISDSLS